MHINLLDTELFQSWSKDHQSEVLKSLAQNQEESKDSIDAKTETIRKR